MDQTICKACNTPGLKRFLELGDIPPVNAFLHPDELKNEKAYPLNLAYCPNCMLAQLEEIVPPEKLFEEYLHLSASSAANLSHLKEVAELLNDRFKITSETKILEIGSNDGSLLAFLKPFTAHVLGIDPAKNLIPLSKEKGVETLPIFFNAKRAEQLKNERGTFDFIIGLNVIPHTPNVVDLLKGVHTLLSPKGTLIMEGVYALETVLKGEFDTIYHEHVYTFSLYALKKTFAQAGLAIVDVERIPQQGGSLRVYAQRDEESKRESEAVTALLKHEHENGWLNPETYDNVSVKVNNYKKRLREIVDIEKKKGKLIGVGAPARGVVILNYCGLTAEDIKYIVDDTHLKHGRLTPGVAIPVKSWDALSAEKSPVFLLLSWNYKASLLPRLKERFPGSRVIIPFPELEVVKLD
ncbi:class I SAM-dependent methyltransferase [Candidatus Pacearchaeota archaeon]|nr:class I SAM-dependent methyltransferase [Candidatus Pacearchaeota archaeon]